MTALPPLGGEAMAVSGATLSGVLFEVHCARAAVEARLRRFGGLGLALAPGDGTTCPVYTEIWNVRDGAFRFGELGQHELWERAGMLSSAVMGAWTAAITGFRGGDAATGWRASSQLFPAWFRAMSRATTEAFGTYWETMTWVPNIVLGNDERHYSLVLGMLTDSNLARFADRALGYGYGKQRGRFVAEKGGFTVLDAGDNHMISFRSAKEVSAGPAIDIGRLEAACRNPLLGVNPRNELVRSWLARSFEQASEVAPVSGTLEISSRLAPGGGAPLAIRAPSGRADWCGLRFSGVASTVSYPIAVS